MAAGLCTLGLAMTGAILLMTDGVFGAAQTVGAFLVYLTLWVIMPVRRRLRSGELPAADRAEDARTRS